MATVKELKATARPQSGKGAARAERRAGKVPGVIYGNNQPPVTISVDDKELRQRILAGRFLTTIYDIDLEGKKHRVIPRDFHLDPVRDLPVHVDFMRLGEGATIRVSVPLHILRADASPGVKRGGTVNIVTHALDLVKREEFDAVKDMARLAREENEALKSRIAALEAKLGISPAAPDAGSTKTDG